ncbi:MAG: HAMP domain-containing sensor histidine kinase [Microscillaceae bacterium]
MRNTTIRWVVALATVSIIGIIITQAYWVRKAFDIKEKQFNQTVFIALKNVAERISKLNASLVNHNPVNQLTSDYFVVNVNDVMDANILEHYLKEEFGKRDLLLDYEYGIYDCSSDKMVYGNYVSHRQPNEKKALSTNLPKYDEFVYYFGVRFPNKSTYLAGQMDIWLFSSFILLTVVVFFAYTLWVILKQKRLSEIQRDFINNMTHEFKTPISTIAVSADLVCNPKIAAQPEKVQQYAQIIKTQNVRLKDQIEKVLQMAVMDKGRMRLNCETVALKAIVRDAVEHFRLKNPDANITCDLPEEEACVWADKVHLTNIIYNLMDNATKYVAARPEIMVKLDLSDKKLMLSVHDNGIGIEKAHQRRIFDRFYRVPTGNRHDVKGFGLGLNYVWIIVRAHGWKIHLHSALGKGSIFSIEMPRLLAKETSSPIIAETSPA